MPPEPINDIAEIQKRILALETEKKKWEEMTAWHQNESPRFVSFIDETKKELHELRKALSEMTKGAAAPVVASEQKTEDKKGGFPFYGLFE